MARAARADETEMAEPAAAPSPSPDAADDEAEFAAIRDALQETARGRRFLAEFSRRQRNADTLMVLDAVARIEARLAAPPPVLARSADAALTADLLRLIDQGRTALSEAADAADAAGDEPGAARAALQAIRDISWTLRECGADVRICDLLDRQAAIIGAGLAAPRPDIAAEAVSVLDRLAARIGGETPPAVAVAEPAAAPPPEAPSPPPPAGLPEPAPIASTEPATDAPTLGATLLADGVVALAAPPCADPLAPFRRMMQAEKLAFFS